MVVSLILLPYLGLHSNHITKRLKSGGNRFYSFVNVKVIFKTHGALNLSSHTCTRTVSTNHTYPKSFVKLVAGTAMIFTLGKWSKDSMAGKWNISSPFWKMTTLLLFLIMLKTPVTTSNGTILTFWHLGRPFPLVRNAQEKLLWTRNYELMSAIRNALLSQLDGVKYWSTLAWVQNKGEWKQLSAIE